MGFEDWYRSEHPRLVAAMLLLTGDLEEAREATDEAFARALDRWPRVRAMASPGGWTYRVALNVLHRRARRAGLERRLLRRHPPQSTVPAPATEVWQVVRQLSPRQREAVILRHVADLTEGDVAAAMRVSRSTVSSTLADAHRRLAELLVDDPNEVPHA